MRFHGSWCFLSSATQSARNTYRTKASVKGRCIQIGHFWDLLQLVPYPNSQPQTRVDLSCPQSRCSGGSKGLSLGHSKGQETLLGQLWGSSVPYMQAKGLE